MVLYLLVILMMLAAVSTLMQMDRAEAPEYSDIRAYFLQRQVESFTLQDNTLTLTLRGEEGIDIRIVTYQWPRRTGSIRTFMMCGRNSRQTVF